jgi:hypothetical protein
MELLVASQELDEFRSSDFDDVRDRSLTSSATTGGPLAS